jgi:NADH-quinone oxidoreductase subunit H
VSPWVYSLIVGFAIANVMMLGTAWLMWFERKFAGRMQNRPGPTEVGPFGLLQPVADLLKLLQKEDIVPDKADRPLFNLMPALTVTLTLTMVAVVPFSDTLVVADLNVGLLFLLAMGSILVIPVWAAGWASNNKYALLGAMRGMAQGISYEIPLVLCALVPVIYAGSFNLGEIVAAQQGWRWFLWFPPGPGFFAFGLFMLCSLAEANRIPFDIPEAEAELVAGVSTEYTGMKFGLFYLAEYLHTVISAAVASCLFLGGWEGPGPDGLHWMLFKTFGLLFIIYWARWTFMRYRSDQLMRLCWYYYLPLSLLLVASAGIWTSIVGTAS